MVTLVASSSPVDLILFGKMLLHSDEQLDGFRVRRTEINSGFTFSKKQRGKKISEFYDLPSLSLAGLELHLLMFTSRLYKNSGAIRRMLEYSQM